MTTKFQQGYCLFGTSLLFFATSLTFLTGGVGTTCAQSICPVETLNVAKRLRGRLVSDGIGKPDPVRNSRVVLSRLNRERTVPLETTTNDLGEFEFIGLPKGRYRLLSRLDVEGQAFAEYGILVRVKSKTRPRLLLITLSTDCFKSTARYL